jgi:hypothetical protein
MRVAPVDEAFAPRPERQLAILNGPSFEVERALDPEAAAQHSHIDHRQRPHQPGLV